MSWRVILRPKAEADVLEAARWYESQRPGLGGQFSMKWIAHSVGFKIHLKDGLSIIAVSDGC